MKKIAIIVAAGSGSRMRQSIPKQFMLLNGKPLIWYTLDAFQQAFDDLRIILVLAPDYLSTGKSIASTTKNPALVTTVIGGDTRFQSVQHGLKEVTGTAIIFVHDGARCLVTPDLIRRCYQSALENGNAIPAIASTDSIRIINEKNNEAIDRNRVMIMQTPQTFSSEQLLKAFDQPYDPSFTDEATVVERSGQKIFLIEGEATNIKITHPPDLSLAERMLGTRSAI